MPANFQLRIVTPEKILHSGEVASLQAPGSEGSFGVLANHASMVASLKTGILDFVEDGSRRHLATSGGFVEVSGEGVTVLAETAEFDDDIDVARAEASRDRASERLGSAEFDRIRTEAALGRALNRLKVASVST
ncbi:MAG TPA: F0F1 ATP synthase subunit epsilon [Candidatus Latescibacteria bacterium]|jgi:F-type H+-transporting ATPase subunit epsilon|nr:ATP synthase F1 subunit epsilon [Gemmatimonadaceae bacterium]HJP32037.1 F0F1 ATP synthase subunit epsilon [Candidatus Latescibacterota bacterium]|tara:strand:+ start:471 stop:872 length:402 start_codon:yes stop_codon:yes gene_type:complete